ncbi:PEP/pyruvate-binding domain-containing protein [Pseudonocardia ailaonensis]|uniref:PEP/pyruvate-binding domain-containing protein n=1 Tax=Pseudonocardia ailaonensis TaxID=367279 RepID=UPI0031D62D30
MPSLVLPLADPGADLATVGGKGASLARAARAGLPVPPGFHVTTAAYRLGADPFPAALADEIRAAYAELGSPAVAVRSSATAEDLPGLSFAGQQDTVLDVRDADAVLDAVRRCWASLDNERAVAYRERAGITHAEMGVVVQELVDADAAGVLFTADPVTGEDRVLVDAAWGLGEAVVGGLVTPDSIVADPVTGAVRERRTADKQVMTVRAAGGTREVPVPEDKRRAPVLDDAQVAELVALGRRVAALYGGPTDIEWALAGGRFALLQARPVTTVRDDPWNDSRGRDHLWTNGNLGEAVPGTITPLTWSFLQIFTRHAMATSAMPGFEAYGRIGGRAYMDLSMATAIAGLVGLPQGPAVKLMGTAFGRLPTGVTVPRAEIDRRAAWRALLPTVRNLVRTVRRDTPRMAAYLSGNAANCAELQERIGRMDAADLRRCWSSELGPLLDRASDMLQSGARSDPRALLGGHRLAEKLLGADAAALTAGTDLESLGPVVGLARVERGELDAADYLRRWGHRSPREFEIAQPRPAEIPGWVDAELARMRATGTGAAELLDRRLADRRAAWARLAREHPGKVRRVRTALDRWAVAATNRERTRSEVVRVFGVLRTWALRAGSVTGLGDDVVYLDLEELLTALGGAPPSADLVASRRRTFAAYDALPPYPAVIRGAFAPFAWAADPARRADLFVEGAPAAPPPEGAITGFPGAAGVVEGTVRVLASVAEGASLQRGEILVTTVTNVGWTPLFPQVAAVVTDVGAPLSHAAIVARELGIPAVVGCGDATTRLRTGDRVRVDGGAGTVIKTL